MPGKINDEPLEIAIVGQGIIGLTLALGLLRRGVNVKVYEQASSLRVTGAGVAFTANAIQCMNLLDPQIVDALRSVATSNGDPNNPNDYLRWVDGYTRLTGDDPREEKLLFKLYAGTKGFEGCHRAHFVEALAALMPEGVVHYSKRLDKILEKGGNEKKVVLSFHDGTTASADAVIGCDGINSRVRENMFGSDNPISHPNYSHKAAYRGLIPMDKAVEALGEYKAKNQHMHIGPKAHVLHFPVVNQTMMNVVAFVSDPEQWPDDNKLDVLANRADLEAAFADWGHSVRSIIQLLPEQLNKWAVFDTYDHPVPYYSAGQVCLAGDAAHAACPHHGAGAGVGIEDALCLASVFEEVLHAVRYTDTPKSEILSTAFGSYNTIRHERTQWLIQSSRQVCDIYEWADSTTGEDPEKCFEEIKWRSHKIWYFDFAGMVTDVKKDFNQRIQGSVSNPMPIESSVAASVAVQV